MSQTILVVGGGITGLATAYQLQKKARAAGAAPKIILIEKDPALGGKTRTDVVDGMVIEHGPDSFLVGSKPWFKQLCDELGLPTVGTNPKIRSTYIYKSGRLEQLPVGMNIMIPTEFWPFIKTRLLSPVGKLRAGLEPFVPLRKSDEDESVGSFVGRRFGREVLENIAGPLMGGIYGGDWDKVSLKSTFAMFMQMEKKGSLLLGALKNKAKVKPKGPTGSAFMTVPSGLQTAVEVLVKACDSVDFRTGVALTELTPSAAGYTAKLDNGDVIDADAVVLATPAYVAANLIKDHQPKIAGELNDIPYGNSCVVALGYDRKDIDHPLDASGFLVPHTEPTDVTAATWVSCKWPHSAPADKVLFRCFVGRGVGKDWTAESDEVILNTVKRDLVQTMGLKAEPKLVRIYRWPRAMAQYQVGHMDRIDRIDGMMANVKGLYLAGAAYRGVGLPNCVQEGAQAAEKIARQFGWQA